MSSEWFIAGARTFPPILGRDKEDDVAWLRKHGMRVWDTVCLFDDGEAFTATDVGDAITKYDFPNSARHSNVNRATLLLRSAAAESDCLERVDSRHWRFKRRDEAAQS